MFNSNCLKCTILPQRIVLSIMGFLAMVVSLAMRACLSVAITQMVVPVDNTVNGNDSIICPVDTVPIEKTVQIAGTRFNWTQEQQGWILSAFYVGYTISHIPGGLLAEKFGGKWTLSIGILLVTICNAIIPQVINYGEEDAFVLIVILRTVMGLASGPLFPTLVVLLAAWVPEKERGRLATIVLGGDQIGIFLSLFVSGAMLSYWPWPIVFYFWSSMGIIWFIAFTLLCSSDPASHHSITTKELDYLKSEIGQLERHNDLPPTPWIPMLSSVPIIVLLVSSIGSDWLFYVLLSDLPKYMGDVLGFSVRDVGLYSSLPCLLMWVVSIFSGFICDYLVNRQYVTLLQARKVFNTLSSTFPGMFLVAASYAGCNRLFVVICMTLGMGFIGNHFPGLGLNSLDLSPNYAGSIMALINGAGSLAGIVVPVFIGIMTPNSTLQEWRFIFWTTFGVAVTRNIIFLFWGSTDVQIWNDPRKSSENDKQPENVENSKAKICQTD